MLKTYLQINNLSMYHLSKASGIPYSTVNDLANNKTTSGNCKVSVIQKLAAALQLGIEEFLFICEQPAVFKTNHGSMEAYIFARGNKYYVAFLDEEEKHEIEMSSVCESIRPFLYELAEWKIDDYLADKQLEVMTNELLHHA
ncbi:MAG: helix-turn-helix transcriptional regulator [Lachnospiraceae bacterium]|nr:helix-turn-helix transcriptional regulator [Lachnospiraceae bacterium]